MFNTIRLSPILTSQGTVHTTHYKEFFVLSYFGYVIVHLWFILSVLYF